jgi:glycosyltransferase involved in cell wall biosynthesis
MGIARVPQDTDCSKHPSASVVICTTGLRSSLRACLDSVLADPCTNREILVIVNGAVNSELASLLSGYPVRVAAETRRGVSFARNTGAHLASGECLLLLDDDVVVRAGWTHALLAPFSEPQVACVTGRVVPEGAGYHPVERYSSPGAISAWKISLTDPGAVRRALSSDAGFGCNLAFRREFVTAAVPFPVALGAGSAIGSGDEHYMFLQVLNRGAALFHTPNAVVSHHFEEPADLFRQRMLSMYSATVALRLKVFFELPRLRRALASEFMRNVLKFFVADRKSKPAGHPRKAVSFFAGLMAYAHGVTLYFESRKRNR